MNRKEFKEIIEAAKRAEQAIVELNRICEQFDIMGTDDDITRIKRDAWRLYRTRPVEASPVDQAIEEMRQQDENDFYDKFFEQE